MLQCCVHHIASSQKVHNVFVPYFSDVKIDPWVQVVTISLRL